MRQMMTHRICPMSIISSYLTGHVQLSWWIICSTAKEHGVAENSYLIGTWRSFLLDCCSPIFCSRLCSGFPFLLYFNPAVPGRDCKLLLI